MKEAVALRKAAIAWVDGSREPVRDAHDRAGLKRDAQLMRAAIKYAEAVRVKSTA
jgi:hypothetical protein